MIKTFLANRCFDNAERFLCNAFFPKRKNCSVEQQQRSNLCVYVLSLHCFMKWQCAVLRECVGEIADGEKKRKIKFVSDLYERRGREEI